MSTNTSTLVAKNTIPAHHIGVHYVSGSAKAALSLSAAGGMLLACKLPGANGSQKGRQCFNGLLANLLRIKCLHAAASHASGHAGRQRQHGSHQPDASACAWPCWRTLHSLSDGSHGHSLNGRLLHQPAASLHKHLQHIH